MRIVVVVNKQWLNTNVRRAGVALIFGICLFGESTIFRNSGVLGRAIQEFSAILLDSETQWLIVLCAILYFFLFNWLLNRAARRRNRLWDVSVAWLASLLSIGLLLYIFHVPTASKSTQALTMFSGALLGVAVAWRVARGKQDGVEVAVLLSLLVIWLLAASFGRASGSAFGYRGQVRWTGAWNNPNTFGLLMGTGMVLAAGLVGIERKGRLGKGNPCWKFRLGALLATVFLGRALFHSLSRGAWMATGFGLGYLGGFGLGLFRGAKTTGTQADCAALVVKSNRDRWIRLMRRNKGAVGVFVVSAAALCFWHFQQTEWHFARRMFSAFNSVDFSGWNRSAAWEGALQISAEHPWLGVGWNQSEPLYEHYYLLCRLTESAAIQLNDYLTVGATLGIPALFCLGMYLWRSLTCRAEHGVRGAKFHKVDWLQTTCRAGTSVLLVGFWFDGGLFKLATASMFWILLELGNVVNSEPREIQENG